MWCTRIDTAGSVDDADHNMHAESQHTIRALLSATTPWLEKRGSPSARLDTELIIGHALSKRRLDLYLDLDRVLTDDELAACRAMVKRRGSGEPIAYILGYREFYGQRFAVSPAVLIPRPDTERLVELALDLLPDDGGTIIDIGTGSGCVALSILMNREDVRAVAVDISPTALAVARQNAEALGVADRIDFRVGDLLAPCDDVVDAVMIVSNPPYIRRDAPDLATDVKAFEPELALFGLDPDALGHHRRIVAAAPKHLVVDGKVLMEIGHDQGQAARSLLAPPFASVNIELDLDGRDRVVVLGR
jgi:release factor glutamine methyltransferase